MSPNRGCASQQPTHSSVASLAAPGRPATHPTTQPVTGRETGPEPSPLGVNPEDLSSGGCAHVRTRFLTDGVFALVFEVAYEVVCGFYTTIVTSYQCTTKITIEGLNGDCACTVKHENEGHESTVCTYKCRIHFSRDTVRVRGGGECALRRGASRERAVDVTSRARSS